MSAAALHHAGLDPVSLVASPALFRNERRSTLGQFFKLGPKRGVALTLPDLWEALLSNIPKTDARDHSLFSAEYPWDFRHRGVEVDTGRDLAVLGDIEVVKRVLATETGSAQPEG